MIDSAQPSPKRGYLKTLKVPEPVWVNLAMVYPVDASDGVHLEGGIDFRAVVPGDLKMWNRMTSGHWVAFVAFSYRSGEGYTRVSQWVLADAVKPRTDGRG
ncbi:hypothetical protein L3Q67_26230 [Saccharothrix sp. AJ9571]|nr:hypothetical protein L3Q67_26230 [Saccharothrix sp. AJ9571]